MLFAVALLEVFKPLDCVFDKVLEVLVDLLDFAILNIFLIYFF